ncbi:MAG TPA: DUF1326 domain-containing protein [Verrucomicrobiae bacterium]|jgi:hypothetical protein|nr:DUF1326 domain-containing protein [Verrucomicrobiae bacterium]
MRRFSAGASLLLAILFSVALQAQQVRGEYLESRSTDVYVAQCFANGEAGLTGNQALMAWHVSEGSWNGVKLDGLTVAAAVRAQATLGDPYGQPYPAEAVLMVDDAANPAQRQALIALAQHEGGKLLENVARVEYVPVVLEVPQNHEGHAVLRAGHLATIITRPLNHHDHICGNETNFYPPLTNVENATSAVALTDEFRGDGLNSQWSTHDRRSAYIAEFSEGTAAVAQAQPRTMSHE